jgi:putative transposase
MFFKVRINGVLETRSIYNILGEEIGGKNHVLAPYIADSEGANFRLSMLIDLKARGLEDILFACIDDLKGFPEAIEAIFPRARVQLSFVHQIRSYMCYVPD